VFIIRNLAYLVQWLDSYGRKDPNAPLWPDFEKPGEPLFSEVAFFTQLGFSGVQE
jgi:hypothetical protein